MEVSHSLIACGAIYRDQRLDTFIYCEADEFDSGKVVVVDLEQVELPTSFLGWKPGVNREGARVLMEDFSSLSDRYHKQVSSRFNFPEALTSIVVYSAHALGQNQSQCSATRASEMVDDRMGNLATGIYDVRRSKDDWLMHAMES
ncbi:hypothetical protein PDE_06526 [Penicillium oxalicum 114-2]|uniref:Uncharacterized protein n=1 Tax=Penicillium oxalicum (strain 114-2 / CGMCC 5302) TaxID=933388 RepID=S7ZS77_PENO1|nr:hypothetical protein PDE_06526 [Penicillium oxalicum 114-2]